MTNNLRILSLGAGVQSSALALMIEKGEVPMVDAAIFADVKGKFTFTAGRRPIQGGAGPKKSIGFDSNFQIHRGPIKPLGLPYGADRAGL
jgi:hypothetical protein